MAASHINDPKYYRERAAQIRALSDALNSAEARAQMVRLAQSYDKLADRAAQQRANGEIPSDR